ncbi:MAG: aconitate hydratase AcnA [Janthinobacterium lividum]
MGHDQLGTEKTLEVDGRTYYYFSLKEIENLIPDLHRLPFSLKVLLENLLRFENGRTVTVNDIKAFGGWLEHQHSVHEIVFQPARVLMQDFTGVPAVVDLAAMREAIAALGGDPRKINPLIPVDLVIDHSVMVDRYDSPDAFAYNVEKEYERNRERYNFLRWGQNAFDNFRVVPPGTGICHQVNLEYLAQVVWTTAQDQKNYVYPDTLVGTDSHTTMVNSLAVLGWGVGGIEAEAAMLGQPISMVVPDVIGFKLTGAMCEGTTATDLVLTITQILRSHGVVNKFVEFYGEGLDHLSLADRATISNMAPEFGATCAFFPIDRETLRYLSFTGRNPHRVKLVEMYAKEQGLWRDADTANPIFTQNLVLNLGEIEATLAGPKRPQDKVLLSQAAQSMKAALEEDKVDADKKVAVTLANGESFELENGHVVIAAITSCTNTSNPSVMIGAGLLAQKAEQKGLKVKPWVKTSLAPGSQIVTDYYNKSGLQPVLDRMGFSLVGYGCTTCIGNSGPLLPEISTAIEVHNLSVASVLSGNRNFEGRIHPQVKHSYLASPLLVVAYALTGSVKIDLITEPLGTDLQGQPVYLKDIWPSQEEIRQTIEKSLTRDMFYDRYQHVFQGDEQWRELGNTSSLTYKWDDQSTYVKLPPYFEQMSSTPQKPESIYQARPLAILGDSITTDHISPAGSIKKDGPAGHYLHAHEVETADFNSFGSRRGNHEIMMRGTFANIRLKNEMVPDTSGGITKHYPSETVGSIFDISMQYQQEKVPLVIIAGCEYGTGSSRDWAAKGTRLLGVKAVIAESFERIHRSNLVGMGILPLEFKSSTNRKTLDLKGDEQFDIFGYEQGFTPRMDVQCIIRNAKGQEKQIDLTCRIDTLDEIDYFMNGGILQYVLRNLAFAA